MRSVPPNLLQPGMIVASSVYPPGDESGLPLVAPGVVITEGLKQRIIKAGARSVLIDDEFSRDITPDPALSDQARRAASMSIRSTFAQVQAAAGAGSTDGKNNAGASLPPEQIDKVSSAMTAIMAELSFRKNLMTGLSDLAQFGD